MKIHALDGGVPQAGLPPLIVRELSGAEGNAPITTLLLPLLAAQALASPDYLSLGRPWAAGLLGSHNPLLACT